MTENDLARKKTVLIVDDQESFRRLAKRELTARGFNVIQPTDSPEYALELIRSGQIDVILFDVVFSSMDGLTFLRDAISISEESTHYIAVSEYRNRAIIKEALRLGAEDYIIKPIDIEALAERISKIYDPNRPEKARATVVPYSVILGHENN